MIDDATEEVIEQIFGRVCGWSSDELNIVKMCPGFPDIKALAELIKTEPAEERLQQFFEERPQFLLGLFGQGDDGDIAFLTKPPVGNDFRADFGILNVGQGGCSIRLVELERSSASLFTQSGTPAKTLQSAMGQVRDWHQWITANQQTFVRDTLERAKKLPLFPNKSDNNSFRLRSPESMEESWRHFGGYDDPMISYAIVAGRWGQMSEEHRKRLVFLNRHDGHLHKIHTYDQLARRAYDRPTVFP